MPHRLPFTATCLALAVAACTVGDPNAQLPGDDDDDVQIDAGGGGGDGGGSNCEALVTPAPDGHHNPGLGCIVGGCHAVPLGTGAPLYTVAGTLYTTTGGTVARAGATILLPIPGSGMPVKMVTASNGNFWLETTSPLPTKPKASVCPSMTLQMTNPATDGNCNSCHGTGSRIALP